MLAKRVDQEGLKNPSIGYVSVASGATARIAVRSVEKKLTSFCSSTQRFREENKEGRGRRRKTKRRE